MDDITHIYGLIFGLSLTGTLLTTVIIGHRLRRKRDTALEQSAIHHHTSSVTPSSTQTSSEQDDESALIDEGEALKSAINSHQEHLNAVLAQLNQALCDHDAAEQRLQLTERYLETLINSMPSALIGLDKTGRVHFLNRQAQELAHVASPFGKTFSQVFPDLPICDSQIVEAIHSQPEQQLSHSDTWHNQDKFYQISVFGLDPHPSGAVVRVDDVTERMHTQNLLIHEDKMMSLGEVAAGLAHELNNPLMGMMQACTNLRRRLDPSLDANQQVAHDLNLDLSSWSQYLDKRGVFNFIDGINTAGTQASKTITTMLSFGHQQPEKNHVDVKQLFSQALYICRMILAGDQRIDLNRVHFDTEIDPGVTAVYCCSHEIMQVLINLVKNAVQAMQTGDHAQEEARINLSASQDEHYIRIAINDNGPGIPQDLQQRIFEPFFTTKETGTGAGLGLSISYFIVTMRHQGQLYVDGGYQHGARFIINLPKQELHKPTAAKTVSRTDAPVSSAAHSPSKSASAIAREAEDTYAIEP